MATFTKTLVVNKSGGTKTFTKIQEAVDKVPPNNNTWIRILVAAGTYEEQVTILKTKPFIYIQGSVDHETEVKFDGHDTIVTEATFTCLADNIVVKNMTFINYFNYPPGQTKNPQIQAVAARVVGDKTSFYNVTFLGVQDTLFDDQGRHYFKSCYIEGKVDFIFGAGHSYYEDCKISANGVGAITAQGRDKASDTNGFVFNKCHIVGNGEKGETIIGNGKTFLGRPWRDYAVVYFLKTKMENIIDPLGWCPWDRYQKLNNVTFVEYDCCGLGANTNGRVGWKTQITDAMAEKLGNRTYVDAKNENWIENQP